MRKLIITFLVGATFLTMGCKSTNKTVPNESNTQQVNPSQGVSPDPTKVPEEKNAGEEYGKNKIKSLYDELMNKVGGTKEVDGKDWSSFKENYMNELAKAEDELKGTESLKNIELLKNLTNEYDKFLNGNGNEEEIKKLRGQIESNIK
ncbi:hypothetical protein FHH43_16415 [Clostridium perfringens]|nr:hypothetical protein [Clostridium perfringens]